uniref:Uncharacterized protein n=1 Tax=Arundo donax TaxID=35708 RepID=A0A0A9R2V8_ARUDO
MILGAGNFKCKQFNIIRYFMPIYFCSKGYNLNVENMKIQSQQSTIRNEAMIYPWKMSENKIHYILMDSIGLFYVFLMTNCR